jgi:hypothetical protein
MVILAVVPAEDKDEAIEKGQAVFEKLSGEGKPFDYFQMFGTPDDRYETAGSGRWGKLPTALRANTKQGKELIVGGMQATKREFIRHLDHLKKGIATFTPAELLDDYASIKREGQFADMVTYHAMKLGETTGSAVWLYTEDGEGIRGKTRLRRVLHDTYELDKHKGCKLFAHENIWVVPADVHH